MIGKRPAVVTACAAAIALVAAGCGSGSSENGKSTSKNIVIGIGEPQHLVPSNATESEGAQVLDSLFYPLVGFDAQSNPIPKAAESIEHDASNKVWTIKLKPGFTFSNGEPVVADNYIDAWNYGAYGPNGNGASYFFSRIAGYDDTQSVDPDEDGPKKAPEPKAKTMTGLKKVDDTTFTVTLASPFSAWESVMSYTAFYPMPKAAFSSPGVLSPTYEEAPIGNGPFKVKGKWEHDAKIEVEKVAGFKGDPVKVDGITWKIYQDQTAAYADLQAGNVDVQTTIPIESLGSAKADLGDRLQYSPSSSFQFVGFPTFQKEFSNPDVRKAISMAIDRKQITEQVFLGSRKPADAFVSPVVPGYRPNACGDACTFDAAKAKQLYTAAKGPASIKITYNVDGGHKVWVDAVCNQIKTNLGVPCTGAGEPKFADLLTKVEKKQPVGLIRLGWIMDYPSMENYLGPLYGTKGSSNYYGYSNPAFDTLVKEGSEASTPEAGIAKWQAAEDILAKDVPVVPLWFGQNVSGHSDKVTNVNINLFSRTDIYKIEVVS